MPPSYHAVLMLSNMPVFLYTKEKEPRQSVLSLKTQSVFGWLKEKTKSKYVTVLENFTELSLRTKLLEFLRELSLSDLCACFWNISKIYCTGLLNAKFLPFAR